MQNKFDLKAIRRHLHSIAEISGNEVGTSEYIIEQLNRLGPDHIIENIGGHGIAAIFEGEYPGASVAFRADLDALPIPESNDIEYKSRNPAVGHKCGHDGHMSILLGFAGRIAARRKKFSGKVIALFQPAEETAQGAKAIMEDQKFIDIKPNYIFGLHNLPGFPKGGIIVRDEIFASASKGMITRLRGESAHAGHPENARYPALAMAHIIEGLLAVPKMFITFDKAALITVIHARLGEVAFGTTPGYAEVMATLRSHEDRDMDAMCERAAKLIHGQCEIYGLDHAEEWVEVFPATKNTPEKADMVRRAANRLGYDIIEKEQPFPWSEDFAYYLQDIEGAFFGLGSGEEHPPLHNSYYDFPDEIIENGVDIFEEIFNIMLNEQNR
jgi:amidohydrolase